MFPNDSAHDLVTLFDAAVTVYPERVAVDDGAQTWTYGQLAARSRQLASTLAARAGRSLEGERVAFCVKLSFDQVALHLAILRLGAAYVPLDPHSPPSRLRLIVEEAAAAVLVTDTANRARLEDLGGPMLLEIHEGCYAEQPLPPREVRPQAPCYVIFTSGSTGRPAKSRCSTASHPEKSSRRVLLSELLYKEM